MSDKNKYFHELTADERKALVDSGKTIGYLLANYSQPNWCEYPEALSGPMGCWSLFYYPDRINQDYCSKCDCFKKSIAPGAAKEGEG